MDSEWSPGDKDVSDPDKTLLIKTKTPVKGLTFGTVRYYEDPLGEGFWFLCIPAFRFYLSGKW